MCGLTLVGVTGHFISYTFIVVIIRDIVGVSGPSLAWLLAACGIAGLVAMAVLARPGDRHPKAAIAGCLGGLSLVFAVLAGLGFAGGGTGTTMLTGIVAIVAWERWRRRCRRCCSPRRCGTLRTTPDGASACGRGSLPSRDHGWIADRRDAVRTWGEPVMLAASGVLVAVALAGVLVGRNLFAAVPITGEK